MEIVPDFTTNLVFMVMSSYSISITLLGPGYSDWRMLKTAYEISLKVYIPGVIS